MIFTLMHLSPFALFSIFRRISYVPQGEGVAASPDFRILALVKTKVADSVEKH